MISENREFVRYKPKRNLYASLGSSLSQVGRIVDISLGGLAFEFISDSEANERSLHVAIFELEENPMLKSIPCQFVYQSSTEIPVSGANGLENLKSRRCGLKFGRVEKSLWPVLADFLEHKMQAESQPDDSLSK